MKQPDTKTSGMYWHAYHQSHLVCWLADEEYRRTVIKCDKPRCELAARQHFLQKVKGKLPSPLIDAARHLANDHVPTTRYIDMYKKYLPKIEALHTKECPNCVWNSKTREMDWDKW